MPKQMFKCISPGISARLCVILSGEGTLAFGLVNSDPRSPVVSTPWLWLRVCRRVTDATLLGGETGVFLRLADLAPLGGIVYS
jgi:hypothetical protein